LNPADPAPARPLEGIGVAVVEDHALVAQSLLLALGAVGAHVGVTGLNNPRSVIVECRSLAPQVVLLDLDLGARMGDAVELVGPLTLIGRVLILSGSADGARLGSALDAGATGVISKTAPLDELIYLIGHCANGTFPNEHNQELLSQLRDQRLEKGQDLRVFDTLTGRERDVLAAMVNGRRVEEMTKELFVTETTVRTHVRGVLRKLAVRSQLAAVARARAAGWTPPVRRS
jgi:two-component system nitrate/nitrite response regulator NarL